MSSPPRRWMRALRLGAVALWVVPVAVVAIRIALGRNHFDSWAVYATAAKHWIAREPLYTAGIDRFQYLPQAALLFAPFSWLGTPAGDIAWRVASWSLLAHGMLRAARLLAPDSHVRAFCAASALAIGPALSSLATGQANLATAAIMLHATVELAAGRLWRTTGWLVLGLALKPILLVFALLACIVRPRLGARAGAAALVLGLLPFALAPADYVVAQYAGFVEKLRTCAAPDRFFADLRGLAHHVGWDVSHGGLRIAQVVAAVGAAALVARLPRRRWPDLAMSFAVLATSAAYLMLFNPRTQPNSYVIVAPVAALAAAVLFLQRAHLPAATLTVIIALWTAPPVSTGHWLKPLGAVVFAGLLVREVWAGPLPAFAACEPARMS